VWLDRALGPFDAVVDGARVYVPFAPFPAFVLAPLVATGGPEVATSWQPAVNASLATAGLALLWRLAGRLGMASTADRTWLAILFGFSTATWWVTMRGGVWHTGQLVPPFPRSPACSRRSDAAGRSFSAFSPAPGSSPGPSCWRRALPEGVRDRLPADPAEAVRAALPKAGLLLLGFAPALFFALRYNAVRFGNPFESGYGLAALPDFLEVRPQLGVFSPAHLSMNREYFLWHLGQSSPTFPWFKPDGWACRSS